MIEAIRTVPQLLEVMLPEQDYGLRKPELFAYPYRPGMGILVREFTSDPGLPFRDRPVVLEVFFEARARGFVRTMRSPLDHDGRRKYAVTSAGRGEHYCYRTEKEEPGSVKEEALKLLGLK